MLTATPTRWYTWNFAVARNDAHLADIDLSWWREKGSLTIEGQRFSVYRERPRAGKFVLESNGAILATAEKPSALRRRLIVEHAGRQYELRPRNLFTRTYDLRDGTTVIGSLSAATFFGRRMHVDLPDTLPLPVRVFVTWLTVVLWKRGADAASGT